ncbi:hypothetical protein ACFLY8_02095 [Halobacteriota archaeon]
MSLFSTISSIIPAFVAAFVATVVGIFIGKRLERQSSINQTKETVRSYLKMFISKWKRLDDFSIAIAINSEDIFVKNIFNSSINDISDLGSNLKKLTNYVTYMPKQASDITQMASEIEGLEDNSLRIWNAFIDKHRGLPEDTYPILSYILILVKNAEKLLKEL